MAHGASYPAILERFAWAIALLALPALVWPSEADELFFKGTAAVSEGELRFLTTPPEKPVHHHQNRITIFDRSLEDGWVRLEQCHEHLDAVPDAQITYREGRIRGLRVLKAENIGAVWAEASSVQLRNVQRGATLCVEAETKALARQGESGYSLSNGPYMRRFLDGYYPMRVSMTVRLATDKLRYLDATPPEQPGFRLRHQGNEVSYDTVFEGMLSTVLRFERIKP